jgi:MFS family permease
MADFHTSQTLAAFSVSVFLLGFGSGPLLLAPLSETFGRKPIYIVGFTIFTLTQIPCALSSSISMLIGFRFLQGFFGSASIANGGGTISDMYDALERTRVVGWYILGPLTGKVI